ncbi:MAG: prolyl oligopeptidase family serine peptidase [Clostridia bacterium]|nr:prolyl oligopeptidase family serine peptidase [Clostridia bacterium]
MQQAIYGESVFDYLLYLPKTYSAEKKYPLLVFLHGAGERGNELFVLKCHSIPKIFDGDVDYEAIVVSPQCKAGKTWNSDPKQVVAFIEDMKQKYSVDEDAVSITGISMGGFGTWQVIMDNPSLFAAAAPICGGGMAWRADTILNLPLRIYHGEIDDAVNVFYSKDIYRVLEKRNAKDAKLFLYPNVGHDVWNQAYGETDLIEWLISKRREK